MVDMRLQRKFLRAPLKSTALYVDGEHVFKSRILNVSEGEFSFPNCLIFQKLIHFRLPSVSSFIPVFREWHMTNLKTLSVDDFERKIIKTKVRMVRSFENQSNVDRVFINFLLDASSTIPKKSSSLPFSIMLKPLLRIQSIF